MPWPFLRFGTVVSRPAPSGIFFRTIASGLALPLSMSLLERTCSLELLRLGHAW